MLVRALASAAIASLASGAVAQLNLTLVRQFVDVGAGGNGNIGVTQDEVVSDYYVLDFSNAQTVHTFDILGNPGIQFTTSTCSPSMPAPNDITYDPFRDTLWLVSNGGSGNVLEMDRLGTCLGGFTIPTALVNPVGITVDRSTWTLFISHQTGVVECSRTGALLTGGFAFTPPGGFMPLSGVTYVPATDRFLITQTNGNRVFEVSRTGTLLSTTSLAAFGVTNTQGLHYNPVLQELAVVDNSLSTTFVFHLAFCSGLVAQRGTGCADGGGQTLVLGTRGCADLGTTLNLNAIASASPLPLLFAGGVSNVLAGAVPLPFDLAALGGPPGCFVFTSTDAILGVAMTGSTATLPFAIPGTPTLSGAQLYFQVLKLDPLLTAPLPLATSNYLEVVVL